MTVEYIRYDLPAATVDAFLAAYTRAASHLEAAPQCRAYELTRCAEAPTAFILRIEWTSAADHLTGFRAGPHFPPFLAEIRPFIGAIAEMRHYEPTTLVWRR